MSSDRGEAFINGTLLIHITALSLTPDWLSKSSVYI
jgi:hypothetical protein